MKLNKNKLAILISSILVVLNLSSCNNGHSVSSNSSFFGIYSSSGNKVNATSQTWSYSYNNKHLLETATDPNGNVYRYDYDNDGRLTKITNPLKQTISFSDFEKHGQPQTIVDENCVTTKLTYTQEGWLLNSTTDGSTTRIDHDQVGNINRITLPDNNSLLFIYDGANYLTEIQGMHGLIKYTRDEAGNIINAIIAGNDGVVHQDKMIYDQMSRLYMHSGNYGELKMYKYDNDDNIVEYYTDEIGTTKYNYDDLQRVTSAVYSNNGITKYSYNNTANINNPDSIIDQRGNKTIYSYNGISNLLKLVSPDSGTHNYSAYDGNGNLISQVDARGEQISYSYDALNRPKEINYASNDDLNTSFTYDGGTNGVGRLTKVQNGISSNSYYYDARGNTLTETQNINNADYTLRYAYDKADNLTNIVYPSGTQLVYTYNDGQVNKVSVNGQTVAEIKHLPFGPINNIKYSNNVSEQLSYSTDYQLNGISLSNGLISRAYRLNGRGKIGNITGIGSYSYNNLNALTLFMNDNYSYMQFYYPDELGNLTKYSEYGGDVGAEYDVDPKSNRILSKIVLDGNYGPIGIIDYSYDNAGNLIKEGNRNYIYDSLNRLKTVTSDGLQNNTKEIANYQYNAFSQRIMKNVNGSKTIFIYNSAGQLLEERDLQTNVIRDYIYVDGKLIAATENGIIEYIVTDHLNTPQLVMDSSGKQIWKADYQPFGEAKITGYLKLNIRADGQYQDDETGLYYNWYRYYDPSLGRYITSDPIGQAGGLNGYIYVNGNPINYTDPTGQCPWCVVGAITGGVGSAVGQLMKNGGDYRNLDYSDIGLSMASGFLSGGLGTLTAARNMGLLGNLFYNGLLNGVLSGTQQYASNILHGRSCDDGVVSSAVTGSAFGVVGMIAGYGGAAITNTLRNRANIKSLVNGGYLHQHLINKMSQSGAIEHVYPLPITPWRQWGVGGSLIGNSLSSATPFGAKIGYDWFKK